MLTTQMEQDIVELFNRVIDAYVSSENDALLGALADEDDDIANDEYKYELSRITTKTEEWKRELFDILHGN